MKITLKILTLITIVLVYCSCNSPEPSNPQLPSTDSAQGYESVEGTISNEAGEPLKGIKVEAYYDAELTKGYPAEKENTIYTDENGFYVLSQQPRYGIDSFEVYVVTTDTAGVYETQSQKGSAEYYNSTDWGGGTTDRAAHATVNFVLKKK